MAPAGFRLLIFSIGFASWTEGFLFWDDKPKKLTSFELYTQKNSDYVAGTGVGQYISTNDTASVAASNFDPTKPTKIFIHGWLSGGWHWYIRDMRRAILAVEDVNFIQVDWSSGAVTANYISGRNKAQQAGREVADLVHFLHRAYNHDYKLVHLIGHSLGAQAVGEAGKHIQHPRVARISGLDPAQPGFVLTKPDDTLDPTDGDFVDVIHTTLVAVEPMGDVDFYPNGGLLGVPVLTWINSHLEAVYIFTESVTSRCVLNGRQCTSYTDLVLDRCDSPCSDSVCNEMGYHASPKKAMGKLYLTIKERAPYC